MDGGHSHRKFHSLSLGSRDSLDRACLESESVACDSWTRVVTIDNTRFEARRSGTKGEGGGFNRFSRGVPISGSGKDGIESGNFE